MSHLLESTRSFLKTSTRLGRRMSNHKDESADSSTATETSSNTDHNLHYYSNNNSTVRATSVKEDPTLATTHRPSTHKRLSGLFSRKSLSEENSRPTTPLHGRGAGGGVTVGGAKIGPDEAQEVMMIVPDDNTLGQQQQGPNQRHIILDVSAKDAEARRRDSKSSERTHQSIKSRQSHQSQLSNGSKNGGSRTEKNSGAGNVAALAHHQDGSSSSPERSRRSRRHHEHGSAHMEDGVPRGRSPTLSMSNSVSTASSSYGGHSPSFFMTHNEDPASSIHSFSQPSPNSTSGSAHVNKLHQSHVWRRNLLEESIMHSLRLGYADRHRSSSRQGSRHQNSGSSDSQGHGNALPKKKSSRARKTREQAILAAAMGTELPPFPVVANAATPSDSPATAGSPHAIILDRSIQGGNLQQNHSTTTATTGGNQFLRVKNSPYQLDNYSQSMTNVRNSIASFTLELPEHRASHVMASSMIPNLFRVKTRSSHTHQSATSAAAHAVAAATSTLASIAEGTSVSSSSSTPRSRRNSRTYMGAVSLGPSPRVLPGGAIKKPLPPLQIVDPLFPGSPSASYRTKSVLSADGDDQEDDEPVSPATKDWVESVFASLDQVKGFGGQDQVNVAIPASVDNIDQLKRDSTRGVSVSS